MTGLKIEDVTLIDPRNTFHLQQVDIVIVDGVIQSVYPSGSKEQAAEYPVFRQTDTLISPGWVDMQVDLKDPGHEHNESLDQLAKAAIHGGFTHVLCHPNTFPSIDQSQFIHALTSRAQDLGLNMLFSGSLTRKNEGLELAELYDMQQAGARAFTGNMINSQHPGITLRALQYLQAFEGLLITYPFDNRIVSQGQMNEGIVSTELGLKGIPELAEKIGLHRDIEILRYTNGKIHFQPINSADSVDYIYDQKKHLPNLSCGLNSSNLYFTEEVMLSFDTNYKVFPPFRSSNQCLALKHAVKEGKVDTICSGHSALGKEQKELSFELADFGMINLQTSFSLAYESLVKEEFISLSKLIELMSINPRQILNLPKGEIVPGQIADLTLFSEKVTWTPSSADLFSRAINTPLLGKTLHGRSTGTIYHHTINLPT